MSDYTTNDHVVFADVSQRGTAVGRLLSTGWMVHGQVPEYGTVIANGERGTLVIKTATGRTRHVCSGDARLRHATIIEEMLQRNRFPRLWWQ